ncbi:CpsD/CapB family tyrosine-protein kinase [Listeria kieliensis]|uniref:non-specific protein-tyrosine kinase n=1 Tax=Listeria kieliensis TaxID=1621700 RepID=A0A3D8TQH2_9LIST|nr:CpsD/CapB family tyrosine-protein kinase [Listeria kieliensis]RDX00844.1 capsular biosynthesis protein [Listeria kieliensis]
MEGKLDKRKRIVHTEPASPIAEQFRTIRANIDFLTVGMPCKVILVTSPEAGTGKSTVSSNLAISYAQQGKKTLLIDIDMRKPTIHKTFNKPLFRGGLSGVLRKQLDILDACQDTEVENLTVLTSGTLPPNPNELLGSKRMAEIIAELREEFEQIIVDAPPVTIVSDALVVAPETDGIILVFRTGKTLKDGAKAAYEQLALSRTQVLGVVLNGVDEAHHYYSAY